MSPHGERAGALRRVLAGLACAALFAWTGAGARPLAAEEIPADARIFEALAAAAEQLGAIAERRVAAAEAAPCAGRAERARALKSTIFTARRQHGFLARETARFEQEPTQQTWQALGHRIIAISRALRKQQERLMAYPGPDESAEEIYGRLARSLDWPFVYQDVRRAQQEMPPRRLAEFRALLNRESERLRALESRLAGLAERPCP